MVIILGKFSDVFYARHELCLSSWIRVNLNKSQRSSKTKISRTHFLNHLHHRLRSLMSMEASAFPRPPPPQFKIVAIFACSLPSFSLEPPHPILKLLRGSCTLGYFCILDDCDNFNLDSFILDMKFQYF